MQRAYKYRLYPSKQQEELLLETLTSCCFLYNHFLKEHERTYKETGKGVSRFEQNNSLLKLKEEMPELRRVHSQVLQNVSTREDLAFQNFFRRVKNREKPGYPRIKNTERYRSMTYPQGNSFEVLKGQNKIWVSKLGDLKIRYHRPLEGTPKTCTISKTPTGKWFVSIACEVLEDKSKRLPKTGKKVGLDVGLTTFVKTSDGRQIENMKFEKEERSCIKKLNQEKNRLIKVLEKSKDEQTEKSLASVKLALARKHEKVKNRRHDFVQKETLKLVREYDVIGVEDLDIKSMVEKENEEREKQKNVGQRVKEKNLRKSVYDASWGVFLWVLAYKAGNAGKRVVKVDPRYTSQDCSKCGSRRKVELKDRVYECESCGLVLDRDLNAATNILLRALREDEEWECTPHKSRESVTCAT